jgi:hypothetical protein
MSEDYGESLYSLKHWKDVSPAAGYYSDNSDMTVFDSIQSENSLARLIK